MKLSEKVFLIGGLLGATPFVFDLLRIPDGPLLLLNPLGILLIALSGKIGFHEKYKIVPREEAQ